MLGFVILGRELFNGATLMLLFETQTSEIMSPMFAIILFLFSQENESIHQSPKTRSRKWLVPLPQG